jgi:hypothetical protein
MLNVFENCRAVGGEGDWRVPGWGMGKKKAPMWKHRDFGIWI